MTFGVLIKPAVKCIFSALPLKAMSHDHVGEWKDDKTLEFNWKGRYEKEDLEEKITVNWVSKDQIEVKETDYSKGKIKLSANYVLKRKEDAEPTTQEAT